MDTYISMQATLVLPNTERVKKILCDTVLSYSGGKEAIMKAIDAANDDELIKKATIEQILERGFEIYDVSDQDEETTVYEIGFSDNCSYDWPTILRTMMAQLSEYLKDGSNMHMGLDDGKWYDNRWYESYEIKDGKFISGERHDFFADDSGCPSDDDIAEAIMTAASILVANPSARTGLAEAFGSVSSVQDIVNAMPS